MKSFVLWFASIAIVAVMMIVGVPKATTAFAAAGDLTGPSWSSNIGWIDLGNNGASYGVKVATTGTVRNLSGYAWSSNIGWVSFNNADCPSGYSNCQPRIEWGVAGGPAVPFKGFARACSVFVSGCNGALKYDSSGNDTVRGGWDGFIALGDTKTDGVDFGLRLDTTTGIVGPCNSAGGCAWGSEVVGWVDFSGVRLDIPPLCPDGVTTPPCPPDPCPDGSLPVNGICPGGGGGGDPEDECLPGQTCWCTLYPTDYKNCPNNCPSNPNPDTNRICFCRANPTDARCQNVGGLCSNIPDPIEQTLIGQGLLADSTGAIMSPYRKTPDGKCLCTTGYVLNPVTFMCTKPVYIEL